MTNEKAVIRCIVCNRLIGEDGVLTDREAIMWVETGTGMCGKCLKREAEMNDETYEQQGEVYHLRQEDARG